MNLCEMQVEKLLIELLIQAKGTDSLAGDHSPLLLEFRSGALRII